MNKKEIKTDIMLVVAAILWGLGFVAQRDGMNYIGPFLYSAIRFGIGVLCLLPVYFLTRKHERKIKVKKKTILIAGLIVGVLLFLAVSAQQIGLKTTTASKASFITALYMILVPIFGIFLKHKTTKSVWFSIAIALAGLYFMSITKDFTIERGDLFVILCAFLWAIHFLFIAHYSSRVGAIRLSIMQFTICTVLSLIVAIIFEPSPFLSPSPTLPLPFISALPSILYGGIGAVGIAYTFHVIALKDANPAYASLILSMESVFGALGGWLILHETMTSRQILGGVLILCAVLLTQIKFKKRTKSQNI